MEDLPKWLFGKRPKIQLPQKTYFYYFFFMDDLPYKDKNWKFGPSFLYSENCMNDTFKVISDFILQFQLDLILSAAI